MRRIYRSTKRDTDIKKENGWIRAGLITLTIAILGGGAWWWYRSTQTNATGADKSGATSDAKGGAAGAGGRGRTVLDVGELLAVDNQIDAATGTIKLKAVFPR